MPGHDTSVAEVTNVSRHGFWLLLGEDELALAFADFPWFRSATIEQLTDVRWPTPDHLYWPQLDVDLSVASIRNPRAYPLMSQTAEGSADQAGGGQRVAERPPSEPPA